MVSITPPVSGSSSKDNKKSTQWKKMNISSSTSNTSGEGGILGDFLSKNQWLFGLFILLLLSFHHYILPSSNTKNEVVEPIYGSATLTPNEFKDIRVAKPNESVLVTGGLGFIGSHVVDLLLHRGFKVTILDNESNGHNHNSATTEMVPNDITVLTDFPEMPDLNKEHSPLLNTHPQLPIEAGDNYFTHVVHLAAAISVAESMENPDKYEKVNYDGSQSVLDWISKYNTHISRNRDGLPSNYSIKKVVAASSAAIYGDPSPALLPLVESTGYGGKSPYADTKYRMEGLMQHFVDKQNAEHTDIVKEDGTTDKAIESTSAVALRFFNVYGPRQDSKNPYSGVISLFLEKAMMGKDITILGDGEMTRDFVYVKDVARAIVLSLLQEPKMKKSDDKASFAVYNVCTGKSITINTLADQIKTSMESQSEVTHLDPRDGDIRASSCNPNGAKARIGFISTVSQEDGLEKTSDWFRVSKESIEEGRKSLRR